MTARLMLAAIEWNNANRSQVTDAEGKPCAYVVYSKRRKAFVLRSKYKKIASTPFYKFTRTKKISLRSSEMWAPFRKRQKMNFWRSTIPDTNKSTVKTNGTFKEFIGNSAYKYV